MFVAQGEQKDFWNRGLIMIGFVQAGATALETATSKPKRARTIATLGGAAMLAMFAQSAAQAGCDNNILINYPGFGVYNALPMGASGGAAVNSMVSVINTVNTAFLTQSTAFVSAPGNPQPDQPGGGVWTRGIGGQITTDNVGTIGNYGSVGGAIGGIGGLADVNCATTTRTNFSGYQAGVDIARLNFGGSGGNAHIGVTAGYMEANSKDINTSGIFVDQFSMKTQIPFVGIYGAFTRGGFFADAQARFDFLHNTLNDPTSTLINQNLDARSFSITGNVGYQFALGNNWFIEPSAGVVYSRTKVDTLNVSGDADAGGTNLPGTVAINTIESLLGRASLRVGTNIVSGNIGWQPFATASVYREFADNVRTNLTTCADAALTSGDCQSTVPDLTATMFTSRVGTYGQFALGVAGQVIGTGWLGYIRGDYRTGDDIYGWSLNGGLRYQFTPEQMAKTGVFKAKAAPTVAVLGPVNWTGFYVGGNVGALWSWYRGANLDGDPDETVKDLSRGFIGGGQAGFNYQMGSMVVGLEGDYDWSNAKGSKSCPNGFYATCHFDVKAVATFAARLGVTWDRTLFFVKGGGAWSDAVARGTDNTDGTEFDNSPDRRWGWMVGSGFEFALTSNWSAKAEYNYLDFGTKHIDFSNGEFADVKYQTHLVKLGVNYRFGGPAAPVVAKY